MRMLRMYWCFHWTTIIAVSRSHVRMVLWSPWCVVHAVRRNRIAKRSQTREFDDGVCDVMPLRNRDREGEKEREEGGGRTAVMRQRGRCQRLCPCYTYTYVPMVYVNASPVVFYMSASLLHARLTWRGRNEVKYTTTKSVSTALTNSHSRGLTSPLDFWILFSHFEPGIPCVRTVPFPLHRVRRASI